MSLDLLEENTKLLQKQLFWLERSFNAIECFGLKMVT